MPFKLFYNDAVGVHEVWTKDFNTAMTLCIALQHTQAATTVRIYDEAGVQLHSWAR
jgi:hypothetical protein